MHKTLRILLTALILAGASPAGAELLFSEDSQEAVARQTPRLKAQLAKAGFEFGTPIFVRIFKQSNTLELWLQKGGKFELFRTYPICERSGALGPKQVQGDDQAPEGFYSVNADWMHPFSDFHLAFNIRYPNDYDSLLGRTGSAIMVHGGCSSSGCFAMTDEGIEEIYTLAEAALLNGQAGFKVHVFPFPLTAANLEKNRNSRWYDFWVNLKEGYDLFEAYRIPPNEFVVDGRYEFEETSTHCAVAECDAEVCETRQNAQAQALDSLWLEVMEQQARDEMAAAENARAEVLAQQELDKEKAPSGEPDRAVSNKLD